MSADYVYTFKETRSGGVAMKMFSISTPIDWGCKCMNVSKEKSKEESGTVELV